MFPSPFTLVLRGTLFLVVCFDEDIVSSDTNKYVFIYTTLIMMEYDGFGITAPSTATRT
jgi:hypothetical protein